MGEEWKIAIGAIAGMTAGLVAEPIRFWLTHRLRRRQLLRLLDFDMRGKIVALHEFYSTPHDATIEALGPVSFDQFDFLFETRKEDFYSILNAWTIVDFYAEVKRIVNSDMTFEQRVSETHLFLSKMMIYAKNHISAIPPAWCVKRLLKGMPLCKDIDISAKKLK